MRDLVVRRVPEADILEEAAARGLPTLLESAAEKVRDGVTSPDEVFRVIQRDGRVQHRCPACAGKVEPTFAMCPSCETILRPKCASCHQDLRPDWKACPFCCAPVRAAAPPQGILMTTTRSAQSLVATTLRAPELPPIRLVRLGAPAPRPRP
jgi:hypothetical protein